MWKLTLCSFVIFNCAVHGHTDRGSINFGEFVCPKEKEALGRCLKDALNGYIPKLATGVPELNIPPFEPLVVPAVKIQQSTGPIRLSSTYNNVTVKGPSKMRITNIKVDTENHEVVAEIHIPEMKMKGRYSLSGRVLMLPIEGEGDFFGKYGDIDAVVTVVLARQKNPNTPDTLKCEQLKVHFEIGQASVKMNNLFGGDKELGNAMNKFLNENWRQIAEELQKPMEEALHNLLKPMADQTLSKLHADEILLS